MLKRIIIVLAVFSFALAPAGAKDRKPNNLLEKIKDNKTQVLVPGTSRHMPLNLARERIRRNDDLEIVRIKTRNEDGSASVKPNAPTSQVELLWPLTHADDNAEYYLGSGAAADTFAIVFTAAAPAVVTEVYHQWFDDGNVVAFGALYGDASSESPDGQSQDFARGDLALGVSPIGKWMTTLTPNSVTAISDYSMKLDIGGTFFVGDTTIGALKAEPFVIVFVKGGEEPHPLADATSDQGGITYSWFGGPWTDNQWGRYSDQTENMCLVLVTYPWGAPIAFLDVNQVSNTYATSETRTIEMDLFDDIGDNAKAIDGSDVLTYYFAVHHEDGTSDTLSGAMTASNIGGDGNGIYSFDITWTGEAVGTEIEYWGTTLDDSGLESESSHLHFEIMQPSYPDADLLIVADAASSQEDYYLYEQVAMDNGIVYEYWNVSDNSGIDASVIGHGWGTIVVFGWGTKTVPVVAGENDPGYGVFLDGGGNLLLVDQDWFFGHGLDASLTFASGDFAFDYFGIAAGENDPNDGLSPAGSTGDTVMTGENVTPIDIPFITTSLVLNHNIYGTQYWTDFLTAAPATSIFLGDGSGKTVGTVYTKSDTYKAVYLAFMADAGVDTTTEGDLVYAQFAALLEGAFTYFGITSPPAIMDVTEHATTTTAGPYIVSAIVVDADADALTAVDLFYSSDSGASWQSAAMDNAGGDSIYAGPLPALGAAQWYFYYVQATDASSKASTYPHANEDALEFYFFVRSGDVLFVDDTDGFGDDFSGPYHTALGLAGANYDTYDVYDFGMPDTTVFTIANYNSIIWSAEYSMGPGFDWTTADNVLADFIAGGGNLLLTGDEALATGYGWPGLIEGFAAGEVTFDFFGLAGAMSDGVSPDYFFGVAGDPITGGFAATDTIWYSTIVTDWTDGLLTAAPVTVAGGSATVVTYLDNGDTVTTITDTTEVMTWSSWYGTRFDNGTHKAVFLPTYGSAIDSADWDEIVDSTLSWFAAANSAGAVTGMLGPELSFTDLTIVVAIDTTVFVEPDLAIGDRDRGIPTEFALSQNYPNPFNPETTIEFALPENGKVVLTVYNMLGQEVIRLADGEFPAGYHTLRWNAADAHFKKVPSGVYFYRIQSGSNVQTMKMLLLK